MIGKARPSVALIQSGKGMVTLPRRNWNGNRYITKKSSTSHGALRKNWTTIHDVPLKEPRGEIRAKARSNPEAVPTTIAKKLISRLNRNPVASNGVHLTSSSSTLALAGCVRICATAIDATKTMASATPVRVEKSAAPSPLPLFPRERGWFCRLSRWERPPCLIWQMSAAGEGRVALIVRIPAPAAAPRAIA